VKGYSGCAHGTFFGPVNHNGEIRQAFARADCKRIRCPRCGPRRAAKYRHRVVELAIEHKLTRFLTLTLDPAKLDFVGDDDEASQSLDYIKKCWAKFRVYLGRNFEGRKLQFICVAEFHKNNGRAHLHILVNQWIDKTWVSETWQAVGGGWRTRIEFADVHRVAAYVSKYLTKDALCSIPRGKKRLSASNGLRITPPPKNLGWQKSRFHIEWFWPRNREVAYRTEECRIDEVGLLYFELRDGQQSVLLDVSLPPPHDQELN